MSNSDSIVKIVARAICCPDGKCQVALMAEREGPTSKYLTKVPCHALGMAHQARAAIAAMRVPTAAMMQAGCASNPPVQYHADTKLSEIIGAEWQAMIDEALKEQ